MDFTLSQDLEDIRAGVRELCDGFGVGYWRGLEPDRYPQEFVSALTAHAGSPR
jgi:acyl-CoA dehydrogenase